MQEKISLVKSALVGLLLVSSVSLQSMESLINKGLDIFGLNNRPTLAEKIAHAVVHESVPELEQLLLNGLDINRFVYSDDPLQQDVKNEMIKLISKRLERDLPDSPVLDHLLYSSIFLYRTGSLLMDWLVEHGCHPIFADVFLYRDEISRNVSKINGVAWITNIMENDELFPCKIYPRDVALARMLSVSAGQDKNEVIKLILSSAWNVEITNQMLEQALKRSSVPGHTAVVNSILGEVFKRLCTGLMTEQECLHALRVGLQWSSMQGRVETVKVLLEAARKYNLSVGWLHIGNKLDNLLKSNQELTEEMRGRLEEVLHLWTDYAEERKRSVELSVLVTHIAYDGYTQQAERLPQGLPLELAQAISHYIP